MTDMNPVQANVLGRFPRYVAGGIDPNDFNRILPNVDSWDSWLSQMIAFADERVVLAEAALSKERHLSAGNAFIQAAAYYHFAQIAYFEDDVRKLEASKMSVNSFKKGAALVRPPVERLEVPFDGINLVGNLRVPTGQRPAGCVFLLPGVDSSKEEMHSFEAYFLERGLATLAFEGPGQGETRSKLPMIDDYERALSTMIDHLASNAPMVDADRIVVYGRSMGGYLAPRAAAFEPRIKAVVSAGGIYDLSYWDRLPEHVKHNFRHAWGLATLDEARARAPKVSLEGIASQVACPFLIIHSGQDKAFPPEGAYRMADEAGGPTQLVIYDEGTHVCDNITYKYRPLVADWACEQLSSSND